MILAGAEMVAIARLPVELMLHLGVGSVSTLVFSGMLVVLGLVTWATPHQHVVTGSFAGFIALGALVLSNLGGLVIGTLLALLGGGLAFAWRPVARPRRRKRGPRHGKHAGKELPKAEPSKPTAKEAMPAKAGSTATETVGERTSQETTALSLRGDRPSPTDP